MSLQQLFSRLARITRSEVSSWGSGDDGVNDELRRAEELIAAEKRREEEETAARVRAAADSAATKNQELEWACRTLGVPTTATFIEISAAYRREISTVHPDRNTGASGNDAKQREEALRTLELNRAYTFLKGYFNG